MSSVTPTPYAPAVGYQQPPPYAPYYPPSAYGYGSAGGGLTGLANVYNSQGQYQIQYQQSQLMKQQVDQAKLDTRRKSLDEWNYEQANTPTLEDNREKARQMNIRRSRKDPPPTEIWNGKALNDLLGAIQQEQSRYGVQGPMVPLSPALLQNINLSAGTFVGSIGLLRDGGKLEWPFALRNSVFDKNRKNLDELCPKAWQEAGAGAVTFNTVTAMNTTVDSLIKQLDDEVANMTPSDYTRSRRYLRELHDTVQALQSPDVAKYVGGQWKARGNSVGELVYNMTQQGLKFAPAVDGGESAYTALHQALVAYDSGLGSMVARAR
jgi:hypothetical protein